jgi:hypothetical protein
VDPRDVLPAYGAIGVIANFRNNPPHHPNSRRQIRPFREIGFTHPAIGSRIMTGPLVPVFAESLIYDKGFQVVAMLLCVPTIIAFMGIWAGAWTKVNKLRLENALKQQMIDRGMSAEDIVTVVTRAKPAASGVEPPCACEAVVETDGEWQTALVLKHEEDRYFVHVVGTEMSDNRWVSSDQIRFPAPVKSQCGAPWDWSFPNGALRAGDWCGRGQHDAKPEPVDQEI